MKTIDLGKKMEGGDEVEMISSSEGGEKVYYPSLYLSDRKSLEDSPSAGEEGTAKIKYRVISKTENERTSKNGVEESYSLDLEIMSITFDGKSKKSDEDMIEEALSESENEKEEN
jgi:stress-induced morphogen